MSQTASWTRITLALCLGSALLGCPLGKQDADASTGRDGGGRTRDAGSSDAGADPNPDAGDPDGGTQAGDAGTDATVGEGGTSGGAPALDEVTARQAGRFGEDLRIDVVGTDLDGDCVALRLRAFLKSGDQIKVSDSMVDGASEIPLAVVLPAKPDASSYVVLRQLFAANASLDHVEVTLVDAAGLTSETLTADVMPQPVLDDGELCDTSYIENRCADGYGCKGTAPSVCMAGEAPKLTRVKYFNDELGTRILVEGTDADLDFKTYTLDLLDAQDSPVMIDTDNDAVPDTSSFTLTPEVTWSGTKFFFRSDQGETFADTVVKVRITAVDRGGLTSDPVVAVQEVAPTKNAGQSCDIRGFDRCVSTAVCLSGNGGKTYSCTPYSTARSRACNAALTLDPSKGMTSVRGSISDPSLWDAPDGCVLGNDPTGQPEAVVKLVLTEPAAKVTLSTNNAYTSFDSSLYAMSKCDGTPLIAWCEDDSLDKQSISAEMVLTNLAAATYYVVVDSFNAYLPGSGTTFQLDVSVE